MQRVLNFVHVIRNLASPVFDRLAAMKQTRGPRVTAATVILAFLYQRSKMKGVKAICKNKKRTLEEMHAFPFFKLQSRHSLDSKSAV